MSKRRKEDVDLHKLTNSKPFKYSIITLGATVAVAVFAFVGLPILKEFNSSFAMKEFKAHGVIGTYRMHYHKLFDQLENLANADAREQSLVRELASVQKELELEKSKNSENDSREETQQIAERLHTEAGSSIARIPDGIEYEAPTEILPHQLQVLGMEYFRKHDYEKSAVIFHELTHLKDEGTSYQKPDNYLVSAISWYKLKHFEMAADYLKLTQKTAEPGSTLYRESILWQSILEHSRGNKRGSQAALTRLMSLYPQSEEVKWINHKRAPASKKEEKEEEHHDAHAEPKHEEHHHE